MQKLAILSALALSSLSYRPHKCPQDYLWTLEGCIKDCKSEGFHNCPDFYSLQFEANFCGLSQDGFWSQYTYQCQACSTPGVIGVIDGPCKDSQKTGQPLQGPILSVHNPRPPTYTPIYCSRAPRPTEQECPVINYFVQPELDYCGLTYGGEKRGFDLACSACKDGEIEYYYEIACGGIGVENGGGELEEKEKEKDEDEGGESGEHRPVGPVKVDIADVPLEDLPATIFTTISQAPAEPTTTIQTQSKTKDTKDQPTAPQTHLTTISDTPPSTSTSTSTTSTSTTTQTTTQTINIPTIQQPKAQPQPPKLILTHSNLVECIDEGECQDWEFCHENKCLDRCAMMRCSSGGCAKGQCQEGNLKRNV